MLIQVGYAAAIDETLINFISVVYEKYHGIKLRVNDIEVSYNERDRKKAFDEANRIIGEREYYTIVVGDSKYYIKPFFITQLRWDYNYINIRFRNSDEALIIKFDGHSNIKTVFDELLEHVNEQKEILNN